MIKPPPVSLTTTEDAVGVWKWNIFLDLLLLALCVAMLKHLFLTILLLRSVHSYCVSSQAKIRQICFWILVKNVFFFGLPTLNFVFDGAQALVFGPFFFFLVLGPLQSSTEQALNVISLFDGVSQSSEVCGGRLRKEMRF